MEPIQQDQINTLLDKVTIPPAPEMLTQLSAELQQDEPDMARLAGIIQKDPGLSALVIRTVNSPMFPLRSEVTSIAQAISMLGIAYMVNIVMGLVLRQTFDTEANQLPGFWDSPCNVALTMSQLSRRLGIGSADEAYMLGLFHNAGHSLICGRYADYRAFYIEHLNHPDKVITEFEQDRYNFDHATLGFYLARSWGLPSLLCEVIRQHHHSNEVLAQNSSSDSDIQVQGLLALLKMAEHMDLTFRGTEVDYEWDASRNAVLECLGLSEPDYQDIEADMLEMLESDAG